MPVYFVYKEMPVYKYVHILVFPFVFALPEDSLKQSETV